MLSTKARRRRESPRGQSLTEFALVLPLFTLVLVGIIVLGYGVFLQQEVTNAAREGARYAALHSATAQCPTVSNLSPDPVLLPIPNNYFACDAPAEGWPFMTAQARDKVFGMPKSALNVTACWSGYWTKDTNGAWAAHDQIAADPVTGQPNDFRDCTVQVYGWTLDQDPQATPSTVRTVNPRTGLEGTEKIRVDCAKAFPDTSASNDMASNFSSSGGSNANVVTVVACYAWSPPLAGFLLIPRSVGMLAVISETLEYQQ